MEGIFPFAPVSAESRGLFGVLFLELFVDADSLGGTLGAAAVRYECKIGGAVGSDGYVTGFTVQWARKCSPKTELYGFTTFPCCFKCFDDQIDGISGVSALTTNLRSLENVNRRTAKNLSNASVESLMLGIAQGAREQNKFIGMYSVSNNGGAYVRRKEVWSVQVLPVFQVRGWLQQGRR